MGKIGCLGEIVFETSSELVKTISDPKWSGSARYATHQRHNGVSLTEFLGSDPDDFTFDIVLSAYLGVNPTESIEALLEYERSGVSVPLVLGEKTYGRYRWTVTNHNVKMSSFDGAGNLTSATVTVKLLEYIRS